MFLDLARARRFTIEVKDLLIAEGRGDRTVFIKLSQDAGVLVVEVHLYTRINDKETGVHNRDFETAVMVEALYQQWKVKP